MCRHRVCLYIWCSKWLCLWNECLSMLMFGWGIPVTAHEAGAEQLWDKAVFSAFRELMGQDHRWAEQTQEKLQKRAARKGCFVGKSCSRGAASAALLPRALLGRGLSSMRRAGWCWQALPSMRQCLCTEATLFCLRVGGGYHGGTRGGHWPGAYGEVVSRVWWSGWRARQWVLAECSSRVSLQPDTLSKEEKVLVIKAQLKWEFSLYGCIRRVNSAAKEQNLTEEHGLNVSHRNSGILCPCCGWTGLLRAAVHTTWERQRA